MPRSVGGDEYGHFEKSDRPDIPVRQVHFRRDWKVSAIREAAPVVGSFTEIVKPLYKYQLEN